jgi:hypothetical protein
MNDRAALYTGYRPVVCISVQDVVMQRKKPIKRASGSGDFSLFGQEDRFLLNFIRPIEVIP